MSHIFKLTWPSGSNPSSRTYSAAEGGYTRNADGVLVSLSNENTYFPLQSLDHHSVNPSRIVPDDLDKSYNTSLRESLNVYSKLCYIDLDEDKYFMIDVGDRYLNNQPFIASMSPFTINVTMTISTDGTSSYFDKSRIYFSLGQHVTGVRGNVITVGTECGVGTDKNKPRIGIFNEDGVKKVSDLEIDALPLVDNTEYTFQLVYNPACTGKYRLILFVNGIVQSLGDESWTAFNFQVSKPRLYFFTSGWINETNWDGVYDHSFAKIINDSSSPTRPIEVENIAVYPESFVLSLYSSLEYLPVEASTYDGRVQAVSDPIYTSFSANGMMYVRMSA